MDEQDVPVIAVGIITAALEYLNAVDDLDAQTRFSGDVLRLLDGMEQADVLLLIAHLGAFNANALTALADERDEDPRELLRFVAQMVQVERDS